MVKIWQFISLNRRYNIFQTALFFVNKFTDKV